MLQRITAPRGLRLPARRLPRDGRITRGRRGVYALSIFYDKRYPQLIAYCEAALGAVFPVGVFMVQREGCTEIKATSKHWPCVFPQHGPGKKHERTIALEPWQQEIVTEQPEAFIRGLIHSDGCRVTNRVRRMLRGTWKYYDYPRYHSTNVSTDLVGILTDTWSNWGSPGSPTSTNGNPLPATPRPCRSRARTPSHGGTPSSGPNTDPLA